MSKRKRHSAEQIVKKLRDVASCLPQQWSVTAIWIVFYALFNSPVIQAAFMVVFDVILLAMLAVCLRVFLECCLLGFNVAEHLSHLRHLAKDEQLPL
jgi:hypothetical protein